MSARTSERRRLCIAIWEFDGLACQIGQLGESVLTIPSFIGCLFRGAGGGGGDWRGVWGSWGGGVEGAGGWGGEGGLGVRSVIM